MEVGKNTFNQEDFDLLLLSLFFLLYLYIAL